MRCAGVDLSGFVVALDEQVCSSFVLLTPAEFSSMPASFVFDSEQALTFWSFAFGTTLFFWLVARGAGAVLNMIRRR